MSDRPRLDQLRAVVDRAELRAPEVSAWSVGMHIEHCCLAMTALSKALAESAPPVPRAGFSFLRFVVLRTGFIPRGRGKAPESMTPARQADANELLAMLQGAEANLRAAGELSPEAWFRHFVFGVMNRDQTLRFLQVHNAHHVKIIRDVLAAIEGPVWPPS